MVAEYGPPTFLTSTHTLRKTMTYTTTSKFTAIKNELTADPSGCLLITAPDQNLPSCCYQTRFEGDAWEAWSKNGRGFRDDLYKQLNDARNFNLDEDGNFKYIHLFAACDFVVDAEEDTDYSNRMYAIAVKRLLKKASADYLFNGLISQDGVNGLHQSFCLFAAIVRALDLKLEKIVRRDPFIPANILELHKKLCDHLYRCDAKAKHFDSYLQSLGLEHLRLMMLSIRNDLIDYTDFAGKTDIKNVLEGRSHK